MPINAARVPLQRLILGQRRTAGEVRNHVGGAGYDLEMTLRLEGITVLADDVAGLAAFYQRALGLRVEVREETYVAFGDQGTRLSIFSRALMSGNTDGHPSYGTPFTGQAFELNFQCDDPAEVVRRYDEIVAAGATPAGRPALREWGQYTGFFADPEGNIHSLFADPE